MTAKVPRPRMREALVQVMGMAPWRCVEIWNLLDKKGWAAGSTRESLVKYISSVLASNPHTFERLSLGMYRVVPFGGETEKSSRAEKTEKEKTEKTSKKTSKKRSRIAHQITLSAEITDYVNSLTDVVGPGRKSLIIEIALKHAQRTGYFQTAREALHPTPSLQSLADQTRTASFVANNKVEMVIGSRYELVTLTPREDAVVLVDALLEELEKPNPPRAVLRAFAKSIARHLKETP